MGEIQNVEQSLASTLFDTVRELQKHITDRANDVAGPAIAAAEEECRATVESLTRSQDGERERYEDVIAELRRQLAAKDKQVDRHIQTLREHGINPLTMLAERGKRDALVAGVARELFAADAEHHGRSYLGFDTLPDEQRRDWLAAAEHALESTADRIIEAGRPIWWRSA